MLAHHICRYLRTLWPPCYCSSSTRVHLSLFHPRLLDNLILVDPIIQQDLSPHKAFAKLSTDRRDLWPSRSIASDKFRKSKFYQQWDPRVLDTFIEYGLRDLPTEQYPDPVEKNGAGEIPVTLTTTVAQEVYLYIGAYYRDKRLLQDEDLLHDVRPEGWDGSNLYRPEMYHFYDRLPELKPSVLYVFGSKSEASPVAYRADKMARTGTGFGGSGGAAKGKVQQAVLDCGHLVGMEKPVECADACVEFMVKELEQWEERERKWDEDLNGLDRKHKVGINEAWRKSLGLADKVDGKEKTKL